MAYVIAKEPMAAFILQLLETEESRQALIGPVSLIMQQDLLGKKIDSYDVDKLAWLAAGLSSADYAIANMARAKRCASAHELLSFALAQVKIEGLFLEFGVGSGASITHIAQERPQAEIFGFDSFEGLPDPWRQGYGKGKFSQETRPEVPPNVTLVPGWFDRTLPDFCIAHDGEAAAFLHVDCDLYASTQTIFAHLQRHVRPGTVIVFDEYFNYPGWQNHEFRAFQDYCQTARIAYRYIGLVPHHQQVAVQVLGRI